MQHASTDDTPGTPGTEEPATAGPAAGPSPRRSFRVLVRERGGSDGAQVIDVQLQVRRTGALVWAQTFSDPELARELEEQLDRDLDELDEAAFRRAHRVTSDR